MIAKPDENSRRLATSLPGAVATIFNRAPFGLSLVSAATASYGRYLVANPAYAAMTGYADEALRARRFQDDVPAEDVPLLLAALDRLLCGADPLLLANIRLLHRDGSSIQVRERWSLVRDERGRPQFFLGHTEDISLTRSAESQAEVARREAEDALRDSELRFRMIAEYAADMIVRTRADRTRSYVSPASKTLLGFEPQEMIDIDFAQLVHPHDVAWVSVAYDEFLAGGEGDTTHTYRLRHKNGAYVWVEAHWVAARAVGKNPFADGKTAVLAVVRDISERKAAEAQIALMACHDPLSGLANRVLFNERLEAALVAVELGGIAAVFRSISTISKTSTIPSGTPSAMRCCAPLRIACELAFAKAIPSRGSAATNSRSFSSSSKRPATPPRKPAEFSKRSQRRTSSRASAYRLARASA